LRNHVANGLTVVGLVGLLAAVSSTAPRWSRIFRRPLQAEALDADGVDPVAAPSPSPSAEAQRTINVKLFFESVDAPGLVLEERAIPFSTDLATQVRTLVEGLAAGPTTALGPTLSPQTKVLEVFVTARGVAYVDLSAEARDSVTGGSDEEQMTVYSVVDSITTSFPSISRVQLLIDNQPATTLAGHVDLSRPLPPDLTLLAVAALTPAEGSEPDAPVAPSPGPAAGPRS
jgi:Sporulation and spore germination